MTDRCDVDLTQEVVDLAESDDDQPEQHVYVKPEPPPYPQPQHQQPQHQPPQQPQQPPAAAAAAAVGGLRNIEGPGTCPSGMFDGLERARTVDVALNEFIDNSLEAKADKVSIQVDLNRPTTAADLPAGWVKERPASAPPLSELTGRLVYEDNGSGMSEDGLEAFATLGKHADTLGATHQTGVFGFGCKLACS